MRTSKKLDITTVCKNYGKIVRGLSITLGIFFFFFFFNPPISTIQLLQFNFFIFGNIIAEILFSLFHIPHIISLSSLLLFLRISATPLLKFDSLLILPNKFEQYPHHKKTLFFTIFIQKTRCMRSFYTSYCWHPILQPAFNLTWRVKG